MRNLTYRIDDDKHIELKTKLMKEGNRSFQEFFDSCTDLYLNDELQIKKESTNMNKTKEYVEGIKEYLESDKIIDLSACEQDGISYNDILDELDNQKVEYRAGTYYNVHDHLKHPTMSIYCDQFYIEQ